MFLANRVSRNTLAKSEDRLAHIGGLSVDQARAAIYALDPSHRSSKIIDDAVCALQAMNDAFKRALLPCTHRERIAEANTRIMIFDRAVAIARLNLQHHMADDPTNFHRAWQASVAGQLDKLVSPLDRTLKLLQQGNKALAKVVFQEVCDIAKTLSPVDERKHQVDLIVANFLGSDPEPQDDDADGQILASLQSEQ